MKKYATGVRFLKEYHIEKDEEFERVDILLARILKDGAKSVSAIPEQQYNFSIHSESVTPKQIAHCLRSLAYKIQKLDK